MKRKATMLAIVVGLVGTTAGAAAADPINNNTIAFTASCSNGTTAEFVVASAMTVTGHETGDSTSVFVVKANTVTDAASGAVLFSFANPSIDNQPATKPLTNCIAFFPANTLPGLSIDTYFNALGIFTPRR